MRYVVAALLVALLAPGAAAQNPQTSSHTEAVRELISLLDLEKLALPTMALTRGGPLTAGNPMAEQLTQVMTEFIEEILPWEKLEPEYIRLYQSAFSEDEVRSMIAFYQTPAGQKLVAETPNLVREANLVVQTMMLPHQGELQRRILNVMGLGHMPGTF